MSRDWGEVKKQYGQNSLLDMATSCSLDGKAQKTCLYQDCVYNNLLNCQYSPSLGCIVDPITVEMAEGGESNAKS